MIARDETTPSGFDGMFAPDFIEWLADFQLPG
jgi:hypothetical protein